MTAIELCTPMFRERSPRRPGQASSMLGIPRRHAHFVYGAIQSGLTSAIAAAIASFPLFAGGSFIMHWLRSWVIAWLIMLPIVLFAAPLIRNFSHALTREEYPGRSQTWHRLARFDRRDSAFDPRRLVVKAD